MEAVLASLVEAAGDEQGVEIYSYHRGEGNTFWFFALMTDEQAEPPQMSVTRPVAALGFDT